MNFWEAVEENDASIDMRLLSSDDRRKIVALLEKISIEPDKEIPTHVEYISEFNYIDVWSNSNVESNELPETYKTFSFSNISNMNVFDLHDVFSVTNVDDLAVLAQLGFDIFKFQISKN